MMFTRRWYVWLIIGGSVGLALVSLLLGAAFFTRGSTNAAPQPAPAITVINLPTASPSPDVPTHTPVPTSTHTPVPPPNIEEGIQIGVLVEVTGTEGDGVRLREEPSLQAKIKFLGLENEVFEVREGPREVDNYEWWFLSNPYNREKEGWAVANYLRIADQ